MSYFTSPSSSALFSFLVFCHLFDKGSHWACQNNPWFYLSLREFFSFSFSVNALKSSVSLTVKWGYQYLHYRMVLWKELCCHLLDRTQTTCQVLCKTWSLPS